MTLATYSELASAIGDWLDRDDLAAKAPSFIRLAEARLNRLLSDMDMEVSTTLTATDEATPLPADFGEMVSVTCGDGRLSPIGPVEFTAVDTAIAGEPCFYCIADGEIRFAPANSTASIGLIYRRTIPALTSTDTTNWLLSRAPDVYLYGALLQASAFLAEEDNDVAMWKVAFDEAIAELRADGDRRKWGAGPLAPRIRRS